MKMRDGRKEFERATQSCSLLNYFYMEEKYTSILFKQLLEVSVTGSCIGSLLIQITYSKS